MIRVDENETFVFTVALLDENTGQLVSGQTVHYDFRNATDDTPLSPTISGTMTESIKPGVYRSTATVSTDGVFIIYTTCSGFVAGTEELIVNPESLYDLTKQNRHFNLDVEDVIRTTVTGTYSQTVRKVPYGKTDYIINRVKRNDVARWDDPTTISGRVYAWYHSESDDLPYHMGDPD